MLMCGLAVRRRTGLQSIIAGHRMLTICRVLAVLYLVSMAVRLAFVVHSYGDEYSLHGAIPVAFHWVLALFILAWARLNDRSAVTALRR
jgi:ribose/xylose/arabinose/galactoside ABC-type transport system permease subunit